MTSNPDPIAEYHDLFERALRLEGEKCATAATLATADLDARPAARVVLIKHVDQRGFVFYTNLESRKSNELQHNPRVALCIYWSSLDKQVRVEGTVEAVSETEADAYFDSRPRGSQIGAWTSKQSAPLASRKELMTRYLKIQARFAGRTVPRPSFWGGFRVVPDRIEIWHNQTHRLHDRFLYLRTDDGWSLQRLYP
jgi:pyridoxamine 5'-phosphate oxidase